MTFRIVKRTGWQFRQPKPPLRPQGALRMALQPLRRRMRWLRALRWTTLGVLAACAACLLWMGASFLIPLEFLALRIAVTATALPAAAFLAAVLAPLPWRGVVYQADEKGLAQRVETLLEQTESNAMTRLLERDTLARLTSFSPKQALRPAPMSKAWMASGAMALLALALVFVPNPQNAVLEQRAQMRDVIAKQADALETRMESVEDHLLRDVERVELRKELSELSKTLRDARDAREALSALDRAQKKVDTLLNRALARSLAEQMSSLSADAMDTLNQALQQSLGEQQGQAMAEQLAEAAASNGDASEAMESLAEALEAGETQEALAEALQQASNQASAQSGNPNASNAQESGTPSSSDSSGNASASNQALSNMAASSQSGRTVRANVSALMQLARNGISQCSASTAGSSQMSGSGGQGSGQGAGQGSGSGSGQGGQGRGQGSGVGGSSVLSDRLGAYESIYDPTRLGGDAPISQVEGAKNEGESTQVELGPGQGNLSGQVPYQEVVGQYQAEAAQAMDRENLPASLKTWVNRYFDALVD